MGIGGIGFSVQHYFREAVKRKYSGDDAEQWEGKELKENKGTFVENPAERNIEKLPEGRKPAIREKNQGAPYSYLANENGVIALARSSILFLFTIRQPPSDNGIRITCSI